MKIIKCQNCETYKGLLSKCSKCGYTPNKSTRTGYVVLGIIISVFAVMFFITVLIPTSKPETKWFNEYNKVDAHLFAELEVKNQLKSPSTADFASFHSSTVNKLDSVTYYVESYVDSQNGFGAMIRTKFSCEVKLINRKQYRVNDIRFY